MPKNISCTHLKWRAQAAVNVDAASDVLTENATVTYTNTHTHTHTINQFKGAGALLQELHSVCVSRRRGEGVGAEEGAVAREHGCWQYLEAAMAVLPAEALVPRNVGLSKSISVLGAIVASGCRVGEVGLCSYGSVFVSKVAWALAIVHCREKRSGCDEDGGRRDAGYEAGHDVGGCRGHLGGNTGSSRGNTGSSMTAEKILKQWLTCVVAEGPGEERRQRHKKTVGEVLQGAISLGLLLQMAAAGANVEARMLQGWVAGGVLQERTHRRTFDGIAVLTSAQPAAVAASTASNADSRFEHAATLPHAGAASGHVDVCPSHASKSPTGANRRRIMCVSTSTSAVSMPNNTVNSEASAAHFTHRLSSDNEEVVTEMELREVGRGNEVEEDEEDEDDDENEEAVMLL